MPACAVTHAAERHAARGDTMVLNLVKNRNPVAQIDRARPDFHAGTSPLDERGNFVDSYM